MEKIIELITPYRSLSLIGAGAGSGKTFHIQKTLAQWVVDGCVSPDRILAVTFTNAAASEMRERIRLALMDKGLIDDAAKVRNAQISTIHGFGLKVLERFSYEQGISPNPRQLTESEQDILVRLSLVDIDCMAKILNDLKAWGYGGSTKGDEFIPAARQFGDRILDVIKVLRNISTADDFEYADQLLTKACDDLERLYNATPFKEESLNDGLWSAIECVRNKYNNEQLLVEWGSNPATRVFVESIFRATKERIQTDWHLWAKLQTIAPAPKIIKKDEFVHEDSLMAMNIWEAADKLSVHPGPLRDARQHVSILINSAIKALVEYQDLKREASLIDFGDMVNCADQILGNELWLNEIRDNFDCLIIDEFQDTNPLQFSLLWKIQQAGIPALIVGDAKQSIMGFQGADARLFASLMADNSDQVSELAYNWRSTPELMTVINELGASLYGDDYTALQSRSGVVSELPPVHIIDFPDECWSINGGKSKSGFLPDSPRVIAREIKRLLDNKTLVVDRHSGEKRCIRPSDIAILANKNKRLGVYAQALRESGLKPQIQQSGWFSSESIGWLSWALAYLSNPNDQYALMCLKVFKAREADLASALGEYAQQQRPKKVNSEVTPVLDELAARIRLMSVSQAVSACVETLDLWQHYSLSLNGEQERANLLKLISLAEAFESLQPETLQAQGVYGRSLSSFLLWLSLNNDDFDKQPDINSDDEDAVVLSTWHKSKGLEWSIVIVAELESTFNASLPDVSLTYGSEASVAGMMQEAYAQVFTPFNDPQTAGRFIDALQPGENSTLKNLTYVSMTRAREQLILPWFDAGKDHCMLSYLRSLPFTGALRTQAMLVDEVDGVHLAQSVLKDYGRVGFETRNSPKGQLSNLSPSTISEKHPVAISDVLSHFTRKTEINYGIPLDLDAVRRVHAASVVGDWVHLAYHALVQSSELSQRLFHKLVDLAAFPDVCDQLAEQVRAFVQGMNSDAGAINYVSELPLLSRADDGAIVSGIIDLLVQTERGYVIIDHKSDELSDKAAFTHHVKQLAAYAQYLKLDKPVVGVGINWVRTGRVELLFS